MESKLSFGSISTREHFAAKNLSAIGETSNGLPENENFVFTSGRSIAHMLPPIKPTTVEDVNECRIIPPVAIGNISDNEIEAGMRCIVSQPFSDWKALDLSQSSTEAELTSLKPVVAPSVVMDHSLQFEEIPVEVSAIPETFACGLSLESTISRDLKTDEVLFDRAMTTTCSVPQQKADISMKQNSSAHVPARSHENSKTVTNESSGDPRINVQDFLGAYKELDTHLLARKVKDILIENNIGQRIFGQAVLGLTQGSVSDLLSHPKSWKSLSLKGREPFIRMQIWLDNPKKIEEIKNIKSEKSLEHGTGTNKCPRVSSATGRCGSVPSKKKSRVVLSSDDKLILLQAYDTEPYPCQSTVHELAKKLNKQPSTVVNWFHNYRSRVKRGFFSCEESKPMNHESSVKKPKRDPYRDGQQFSKNNRCKSASKTRVDNKKGVLALPTQKCKSEQRLVAPLNIEEEKDSSSMFITATVLLGTPSRTVSPMWSIHMDNNHAVLTPGGALKNLFLGVYSTDNSTSSSIPVVSKTNISTLSNNHFETDLPATDD